MNTESIEALRTKAQDAVVAYDCGRCWSAWGWGTMGEEDFTMVAENPDRVTEITDAVLEAVEFENILQERDALREELNNLRESIYSATADIVFTVNELGKKAA